MKREAQTSIMAEIHASVEQQTPSNTEIEMSLEVPITTADLQKKQFVFVGVIALVVLLCTAIVQSGKIG